MKQQKIDTATRDKLFSANSETVLSAIETLREKGNKEYLPILFELLFSAPEEEVKNAILKLLGTVKDKETIPVFIDALQNKKYISIRKEIATACWQNGLDFSGHVHVFADLIINENWEVAFEAFTVIENLEHFPPEEEFKAIRLKVAGALKTADEKKQYFLEEILRMSS
ncbi:MAG: HEAT repeat domain-containing protein [Draconibacterium sp.]